jgi:dolichyl-phosphate-mannose--protein O-mannosyl transferase
MKTLYTILFPLLLISFFIRLYRLTVPDQYVFDEVYHVVTVKAYARNDPAGYEWWHQAPEPNTAYDWLHPPLAKLIQAAFIKIGGDRPLFWRLPSAIFGTFSIAALYYLGLILFKRKNLALLAALIFSLDGLQLTMSRITMNDIFVTIWIILALAYFYQYLNDHKSNQKHLYLTGIFTGLALATKWSALLLYPIFAIFLLFRLLHHERRSRLVLKILVRLILLPLLIYLLSYLQFFLQGHSLKDFYQLHQQIFWYQTNLTATHDYQSSAWQWPLLIRPVWFYVAYAKDSIANIYNLGNPAVFWGGLAAVVYVFIYILKNLNSSLQKPLRYLLISYFLLWLPWIFSPRILFLHHYLPALPLLCLLLAWVLFNLKKTKPRLGNNLIFCFLAFAAGLFIFFYPLNTAVPLPNNLLKYWFWFPSWR